MRAHTHTLRDRRNNRKKINISSDLGNLTFYNMQPPYLRQTSKKERSQSRFLRGTGNGREHRRSFLALECRPCGTVRGHDITMATLHSELLSLLIPPGPCSFQPPPFPTRSHSGLCQEQQMDTRFVITSRARRLGPSPVTQSDSSAMLAH